MTGGWLFAPAALSDDGRVAAITREGFLFEWDADDAPACQSEWPSFRHDPQSTGNYDADGTAPAAPDRLALIARGGTSYRLGFRSPGDDALCGTAARYIADIDGQSLDLGAPVEGGTTFTKDITLPDGARRITIRAADGPAAGAFNLGPPGVLERAPAGDGGASGRFTPVVPGSGKLGKARLKLKLRHRKSRTRSGRSCARGRVRVTVTGADRRLIRRARLRVRRRSFADRRAPFSRVFRERHTRRGHVHRARVLVRLKDGRRVRLASGSGCARGRRERAVHVGRAPQDPEALVEARPAAQLRAVELQRRPQRRRHRLELRPHQRLVRAGLRRDLARGRAAGRAAPPRCPRRVPRTRSRTSSGSARSVSRVTASTSSG